MEVGSGQVDELGEKPEKGGAKEALVVFIAVEKNDSNEKDLVKNIKDIAKQVKAKNIVLYPYAHLSSNLGSPEIAVKILLNLMFLGSILSHMRQMQRLWITENMLKLHGKMQKI